MAQSVSLSFQGEISLDAQKVAKVFEDTRRTEIAKLGKYMRRVVQSNITGNGVVDYHRFVQKSQILRQGSIGGYAVVQPSSKTRGSNSPGAITNYLESGHRVRMPSGKAERYVPQVKKFRAKAYGFYADSRASAQRLLDEAGQKVAEAVAKALEDL